MIKKIDYRKEKYTLVEGKNKIDCNLLLEIIEYIFHWTDDRGACFLDLHTREGYYYNFKDFSKFRIYHLISSSESVILNRNIFCNSIHEYLEYLCIKGIINWEIVTQDRNKAIKIHLITNVNQNVNLETQSSHGYTHLNETIIRLRREKEEILNFSPERMDSLINQSLLQITDFEKQVEQNEFIKPLKPVLNQIHDYLKRIDNINKVYQDIYLNVIRPIKEEGNKGFKTTVKWAIISIILSSLLSTIVGIFINLLILK